MKNQGVDIDVSGSQVVSFDGKFIFARGLKYFIVINLGGNFYKAKK